MAIEINGIPVPEGTDTISAEALQAMVTALTEFPESGSNANESYIKFDDGTMITHHSFTVNVTTSPMGNLHAMLLPSRPQPVNFASAPSVVVTGQFGEFVGSAGYGYGSTVYQARIFTIQAVSDRALGFSMLSTGRWK